MYTHILLYVSNYVWNIISEKYPSLFFLQMRVASMTCFITFGHMLVKIPLILSRIFCFSYRNVYGLLAYKPLFRYPHKNKSVAVRFSVREDPSKSPFALETLYVVLDVCNVTSFCWNHMSTKPKESNPYIKKMIKRVTVTFSCNNIFMLIFKEVKFNCSFWTNSVPQCLFSEYNGGSWLIWECSSDQNHWD